MKFSSVLVLALFTSQISAVQLEAYNMEVLSCPGDDAAESGDGTIPIKIKRKGGGGKLKAVLKAIASEEDDEPKVSVVRVPAPACPAAKKDDGDSKCSAKKGEDGEDAGKKAGKEAKKAVEKALKKQEDK